ncbi:hypothetical protein FH972_012195 [Carpinus fangiana]|uniref:Uncharacterized protein n=1 Tax=Carpinus fangiana TaxID=176857 RepID=A0A5N6R3X6_9ROSI|nr:hypothetical protein FH972_012195 [Carpinus fangiana]
MMRDGLGVDRFSFPPLLKAVSRASALEQGMEGFGVGTGDGDSRACLEVGFGLGPICADWFGWDVCCVWVDYGGEIGVR